MALGLTSSCTNTPATGSDAGVAPNFNHPPPHDGGAHTTPSLDAGTDPTASVSSEASTRAAYTSDDDLARTGENFSPPGFEVSTGGAPSSEPETTIDPTPPSTNADPTSSASDVTSTLADSGSATTDPTSAADPTEADAGQDPACETCPPSLDACVVYRCNPETRQCEPTPNIGATCDDGNACTTDDTCDAAGNCAGLTEDCSDLDDQCLTGVCNASNGACEAVPARQGESCDDADPCTLDDVCNGGECDGAAKDCSSLNDECVIGVCEPESGKCEARIVDDGTRCDDQSSCTTNDVCKDGVCSGIVPDKCGSGGAIELHNGAAFVTIDTSCSGVDNDFNVANFLGPSITPPGADDNAGDCVQSTGPDVYLLLDLSSYTEKVRVVASTDNETTLFDTVLALVGADSTAADKQCGYTALTACNDDISRDKKQSRIDVVVSPGLYLLVADGFISTDRGVVGMSVRVTPQP